MVYSIRSNKPIVSTKPVKTKRKKTEFTKELEKLLDENYISVDTDESGAVVVKVTKR